MGIIDKQLAMEIENLYDHFNIQMTIRLKKERKRARRGRKNADLNVVTFARIFLELRTQIADFFSID
jgi:hypothetical protein